MGLKLTKLTHETQTQPQQNFLHLNDLDGTEQENQF